MNPLSAAWSVEKWEWVGEHFRISWVCIAPRITFSKIKGLLQLFGMISNLSFDLQECYPFKVIAWTGKFLVEMFAVKSLFS